MRMHVVREREQWGKGAWVAEVRDAQGQVAFTSDMYRSRRDAVVDALAESFLRKIEVL